jgi:UPF0755 protein
MTRKFVRILMLTMLVGVIAAAAGWWALTRPAPITSPVYVNIPRGTTSRAALDSAVRALDLPLPWALHLAARVQERTARTRSRSMIHAGWYRFNAGTTAFEVLRSFYGDGVYRVRVTIPEGYTAREMARLFRRTLEIDSVAFMKAARNAEGRLMPNTYDLPWRAEPSVLVTTLTQQFATVWDRECALLAASSSLTKDQVITLASIVQSEAASIAEMPRIAGVYVNRLRVGMPLAADPTVQYAIGERRRLTFKDLEVNSPYNTYGRAGLPPGPICNPGVDALKAALRPERHGYFFFVANPDGSGTHVFAKTGEEHVRNAREYRRKRDLLDRSNR